MKTTQGGFGKKVKPSVPRGGRNQNKDSKKNRPSSKGKMGRGEGKVNNTGVPDFGGNSVAGAGQPPVRPSN